MTQHQTSEDESRSLLCVLLQQDEDHCDASTAEMEVQVPDETEDSYSEILAVEMEPSDNE
jgi:hypothetical protein